MTRPILLALGSTLGLWLVASSLATSASGPASRPLWANALGWLDRGRAMPEPGASGNRVLVVASDLMGHYTLHPVLDGYRTTMLVDTGATLVALTSEDAFGAGFRLTPADFTREVSTANGTVAVARIRIRELAVGDIVVRDVDAVVLPRGRLDRSLLGMSFLRGLSGFEVSRGRLTLRG